MKILMIIDSLEAGGKERRLLELLKKLILLEPYEIELLVLSNIVQYAEYQQLGIRIHCCPRRYTYDLRILLQLGKLIRKISPDLIQSWSSMSSVLTLPIAKGLRIPFINAMVADAPPQLNRTRKIRSLLTFPFSDVIIANSRAGLHSYRAPYSKSHCIHNGFDIQRVARVTAEASARVRTELDVQTSCVVGMVGRFHDHKDYPSYLEAALRILRSRPDTTFLAVGDGKNLKQFRQRYRHERLIFTGRQENVETIVSTFTVGVLTTDLALHGEGISNALMEYMALQKPVIATDGGGTAELVTHGVNGYLIPPGDVDALEQQILYLIDHPDVARRMGQAGYTTITQDFSMDRMVEAYVRIYQKMR